MFQEPFGRKSMDTQYESGPMESATKLAYMYEEECETEPAHHQLSATEKAQYHQIYWKLKERCEAKKSRPMTVKGSDLVIPQNLEMMSEGRSLIFSVRQLGRICSMLLATAPLTSQRLK